jgi:DNA-binding response OmpR family regulator
MANVVLIVDDKPTIRTGLTRVLDNEGFAVRSAEHGAAALALLEREPADLIISDVMMPILDGVTFVQELRRRGNQTPVVLMSSTVPDVGTLPGVRFIAKPFDVETLLAVMRQSLTSDRS